ncbi:MAG: glycosyltransferase family 9 protein [Candidatus Omnitrophota bacterium]
MKKSKRIVIFNVNWLGDVLFSTATIRNIRRNYPNSYLACIIPSRCYLLLKDNPYLDEIIVYDEKDRHRSVVSKIDFIRLLKFKKFNTAILLHGSLTRALICKLAGIRERIGYDTKKRGFLLTKKIKSPDRDSLHRIDYYLNIVEKAGFRIEDRYLDFIIRDEDENFVNEFFKKHAITKGSLVVGLNAGGNWLPKRWPKGHWLKLANLLTYELSAKVIITGSQLDIGLVQEITASMITKPIIACGLFNLKQLGALFKRLDLFISADTGPLHIANAVGAKRIIALFGPTDPLITGPFPIKNVTILQKKVGCKIPCYVTGCLDNHCMKAITPEEVFEQVKSLLNKK